MWLDRFVVFQQSFANDPPRIVLARIQLLPVDVVDFRSYLVPELLARPRCHPAEFLDEPAELRGILRQPLGPNHQYGNDRQCDELEPINSKHVERLPSAPP